MKRMQFAQSCECAIERDSIMLIDNSSANRQYRHFKKIRDDGYVEADTNIGLPCILIKTHHCVQDAFSRIMSNTMSEEDWQILYSLFHEYVHVIQMVVSPICQLISLSTLWELYDLNQNAISQKALSRRVMHPIKPSDNTSEFRLKIESIFSEAYEAKGSTCLSWTIKTEDLIEGIARMLEECFRKEQVSDVEDEYTRAWRYVKSTYGETVITESLFLDICEFALQTDRPAESFYLVCKFISNHSGNHKCWCFDEFDQAISPAGITRIQDLRDCVVKSVKAVCNNPLFETYCKHISVLYDGITQYFNGAPVFSSIYQRLRKTRQYEVPRIIIELIAKCGTPIICSENGEVVQYDKVGFNDTDQTVLGIDAVYSIFYEKDENNNLVDSCKLIKWCDSVPGNKMRRNPLCENSPWEKDGAQEGLCPFLSVWKMLDLVGMTPRA